MYQRQETNITHRFQEDILWMHISFIPYQNRAYMYNIYVQIFNSIIHFDLYVFIMISKFFSFRSCQISDKD